MSASASVGQVSPSDGVEAIEGARKARDALFSTKFSATLRKERDETVGIKAMFVGLMTKEERGGGDEENQEMEEQDNDNNSEEGEEEEVLASSSDDDEDGIVGMIVRGSRTRTRNPRVFNDHFV
jgi:hypothetical protein